MSPTQDLLLVLKADETIETLLVAAIGRFVVADLALLAVIAHHPDRWYVVLPLSLLASWIATQAIVEAREARKLRRLFAEYRDKVEQRAAGR